MSVSQSEKATKFRKLHEGPGTFLIPNPWDGGTARMLTALGFEALATTSAGLAFSLGRRDGEGLVTREEVLAHIREIVGASDLPVSADLENGFGDAPEKAAETIRLGAAAGLVGGSIEDATGDERRPIYDHGHAVERVKAAVEAARTLPFPFTLTARAENFLHGRTDLDDTMRRLQAFAEAGADVVYAPGLPNLEAIRSVCAAVAPRPVNALVGAAGRSVAELAQAGVRRISTGSALHRAAMGGFWTAAKEMKEKGTFGFLEKAVPFAELSSFMAGR
ncbi:MAG: isocitrate lyase/phosphoenolpyruvate mutase family protein [Candidatus Acidiferrum sp.]|jgi:2-methylisocitrate lyase-like PEP mutase family enzyme